MECRIVSSFLRQETRGGKSLDDLLFFAPPFLQGSMKLVFAGEHAQTVTQGKILSFPKSSQGGKIVGAHGSQSVGRIRSRFPQTTLVVSFKVEKPVGKYTEIRQGFPYLRRNRAQILANDQGLGSGTFKRQDLKEVLVVVFHINSIFRSLSLNDPEKT